METRFAVCETGNAITDVRFGWLDPVQSPERAPGASSAKLQHNCRKLNEENKPPEPVVARDEKCNLVLALRVVEATIDAERACAVQSPVVADALSRRVDTVSLRRGGKDRRGMNNRGLV